jgi:hypothetical protein
LTGYFTAIFKIGANHLFLRQFPMRNQLNLACAFCLDLKFRNPV